MKPCFVIAHKWIRGPYHSYLKYYIENINKFYEDALIIVVDNNSVYKEDIFSTITDTNVIFLDNDTISKFEIGAYIVASKYIIENKLDKKYDYFFYTQDNYIIKNKVSLEELMEKDIYACPITTKVADGECGDVVYNALAPIGLYNRLNEITFVPASSFLVHGSKIEQLYSYIKHIVATIRWHCAGGERYLARIIYELNNHKNNDLDGDVDSIGYNSWTIDLYAPTTTYFAKKVEQKHENTKDI